MIYVFSDVLGVFFLVLGLGYLYRPQLMSRVVRAIRDTVFNDAHIALERKKFGLFFLLLALLAFYLGIPAQR